MYYIYGKDGEEKVLLFDTAIKDRAIEWAKKYSRYEYMGGWPMVYVCYEDQVDINWEGEAIIEEVIVWSCYQEPMDYPDNAYEEF
jgi:hypothetical protein